MSVLVPAADLLAGARARTVLLDVRWSLGDVRGRRHYLPGAVFVDRATELADPASAMEGRHPLPTTPPVDWPRPGRGGCCGGAG